MKIENYRSAKGNFLVPFLQRGFLLTAILFALNYNAKAQSDLCASAVGIAVNASCITTSYNVTSLFNNDGPAYCSGTSFRDGWFTFTTDAVTTSVTVTGTGNRGMGLAIYSGVCGSLVQVACNNPATANATLTSAVSPSTTYLLRISRTNNANANDMIGTVCIVGSNACSGTPNAGSTLSNANPACSGASFTLSLSGASTAGGITYQWQSSPNNSTWTNVSAATNATLVTTQTAATWYRCVVTCSNSGLSANSVSLLVNLSALIDCYCVGNFGFDCSVDYISNVTFGTINNTTTCSGSLPTNRTGYTSPNPTFFRGSSYPISITTDGDQEAMRAWIDYDRNLAFAATESVLLAAPGGPPQTTTGTITIPLTASLGQTVLRVRCRYATAVGTGAACTNLNSDFGETEDYLITIADPVGCSGTPVPGSTVSSSNPACSSVNFTLSMSNNITDLGITYQWQSSPNGSSWTNVAGTTSTLTTSQTTATYYRCIVTCTNSGLSANSTPLLVTLGDACQCGTYCTASQTTGSCGTGDEFISNIVFNTINNSSSCAQSLPSGYTSYLGISTTIQQGLTYPITFTNGGPFTGDQGHVFFDWNGDGDWLDAGEDITLTGSGTSSATTWTGNITVPVTSITGVSRMRARVYFTTFYGPCGAADYGEAEDYCINIIPATPCSGPPAASSTISSANPACYNTAFTLSLGSTYTNSGITFQWQSAPDVSGSPGTFTNVASAGNSSTYSATQTAITWYHCLVTCSNTAQTTTSANLRVTTQLCYCTPVYTTGCTIDYISNFILNTLSNNSGSTCSVSPPGYSVYPPTPINQTTTLSPGTAYTATIAVATGNANGTGVAIWIDYNDNGVFDVSENNNNGATKFASNTTGTLVVNIPANAAPGQHRLRVVSARNTLSNAVGACAPGNAAGEAEDYTVTVGDPTASSNTPICAGDTLHLFAVPSGATSYNWSGPNGFTSTLQNPSIPHATTAASGLYTATIVIGSTTYTPTTNVIVNASPAVSVTSNAPFCSATQNLSLHPNAPTAVSYSWTGPSFTSTSANPSIASATNAASGTYKVVVTDNHTCKDSSSAVITIYALPNIGITLIGSSNLCTGQTSSDLQATGAGGTGSYSWTTGETTDLITVSTAGTYAVTGTDNHSCVNTFSQVITESTAPAAPVTTPSGTVTLCFNSGGVIGITLHCTNYSNNLQWSTAETTSSIFVDYDDVFTVTYTDPNGCFAASNPIFVNLDAIAPSITCPADVVSCSTTPSLGTPATSDNCSVNSVTNDAPAVFPVGTTDVTWTVTDYNSNSATCVQHVTVNAAPVIVCPGDINDGTTDPGGMVETFTAPSGGSPAVTATCTPASGSNFPIGTTVVNCSATNVCGTGTCSFNVNITLTCVAPVIGACPGNITQCDNHIATWTDPAATGTPAPSVVCSPASGSTFATGTTTVTCTATNVCGSDACSFTVTINESPEIGACPADISTCNPVVTFSTPAATGTPAPTVTCIPASGSTFAIGTTSVTCTASNSCGSSSCSFNVNVETPSTAATSATSDALYGEVCSPGSVTLTANGGSLGTGASWIWYDGACGGVSVGSGASITLAPAVGTHNYFVRAEGACGATACQSVTINVITAPPSGTVHYTASIADGCVGAPAAIFTVNTIANCTFYNWSSSVSGVRFNGNPSPFQTTTPTVNVTFVGLPAAGTSGWSICVFGGNACGNTNTICTWVRATVSAPTGIVGSVIGCPGSTANAYSSTLVAGAVTYQWTSTGGIVVNGNGSQAVTVDFPAGFVSGTLSVHGQTSCGYNGVNKTITINKAPAIPGIITGTSYPCPNASSAYSVTVVPGASNYTWTTSVPGAVVTGTTNTCSILFPASIPGGSSVSVVANSDCPTSSAVRSKGIASGIPGVPVSINGPASGQCGQTGVSYSITPMPLATGYNWSTTCGSINGPANLSGVSIDWPSSFTTCTLSVSATNACGTGTARILGVTGAPAIPAVITGNATPCANTTEVYSTTGSVGATSYTWTVPAGAVILGPANGASILVQWGATGGNITVKGSNTCGNSAVRSLPCVISCRMSQVQTSAGSFNAEVYPNPASNKATVKFTAAYASQYSLNIIDVLGQNVLSLEGAATEGINVIELNVSSVSKGVYLLDIVNGDNVEQIRLVIQ